MDRDRPAEARRHHSDAVAYRAKSGRGEGQLANVSETGVFVRADFTPDVGEEVHIVLNEATRPLSLRGKVGWIGRRHDGVGGFGAILLDPPTEYIELVRSIALHRHPEGPQPVSPRIAVTIPVTVELGTSRDAGTLSDLSLSGARLENTAIRPALGSLVTLLYAPEGYTTPFEVIARVVRPTDTGGYAVQFEALDPELKHALQYAVSALSRLPSSAPPG
jgi:hypothetical protein